MEALTGIQTQVAELLAEGMTLGEIGVARGVSESAVKASVAALRRKLGVDKTRHIVPALREKGLL